MQMRMLTARALIGIVFLVNVLCAVTFIIYPGNYAPSFELADELGEAVVQAMGVLFLMWNVPYAVAFWHPVRFRISLYESVVMQAIGLVGETFIFFSLPALNSIARASIARFILFDGLGLVALLGAAWMTRKSL